MPHDLLSTVLHESPLVAVRDVRCTARRGEHGHAERSPVDSIVFPRRGAFVRVSHGAESFADANAVLFYGAGEDYRVHHPIEGGDDCTVLTFSPHVLEDALGTGQGSSRAGAIFPRPQAPHDAGTFAALQRLRAAIGRAGATGPDPRAGRGSGPATDDLEIDELAIRLLARLAASLRSAGPRPIPRPPRTARAHRDAAHAVRSRLAADASDRHSLDALARDVRLSPFHLARVFARETGGSIHRHLVRLRLAAACERLADGVEDLTALALDLGFASHSHFTDTFRRELGVPPSAWRRASRATGLPRAGFRKRRDGAPR